MQSNISTRALVIPSESHLTPSFPLIYPWTPVHPLVLLFETLSSAQEAEAMLNVLRLLAGLKSEEIAFPQLCQECRKLWGKVQNCLHLRLCEVSCVDIDLAFKLARRLARHLERIRTVIDRSANIH